MPETNINPPTIQEVENPARMGDNGTLYFDWDYEKYQKYVKSVKPTERAYRNPRRANDSCIIHALMIKE